MPSSGGIIKNCVRYALNGKYKMVKHLKMLKTSVKCQHVGELKKAKADK
jgi:hypothetical protein